MRLLLAAAQPNLRLSLELFLSEQPGVEIVGSASESAGLVALIHTTDPDMILTDWDLPANDDRTCRGYQRLSYSPGSQRGCGCSQGVFPGFFTFCFPRIAVQIPLKPGDKRI